MENVIQANDVNFFIHDVVLFKDVDRLNAVQLVLTDKESFIMNIFILV